MNALVIGLFISVFAGEYLAKQLAVVHQYFILLPELFSVVALLLLFKHLLLGQRWALEFRYLAFLVLYVFVVCFGFLAQSMEAGPIVAGMRNYLKFVPFLLLPAVYQFKPRELAMQVGVLLTLLLVQSPLAVYQRFVQYGNQLNTGDVIRGFTTTSNVLSVLMLCAIVVVVCLYLRRRMSFGLMLIVVAVLFVPTTLNETKATMFLLPVAFLLPPLLMPRGSGAFRKLLPVAVVGTVAALAFVSVYDSLIQHREEAPPIGAFLSQDNLESYLYTGAAEGEKRYIGRFDSIVIALDRLADDPLTLLFGLGAGNVSESPLPSFAGQYATYFLRFGVGVTQISNLLWELGLFGLLLHALFYYWVWKDARFLAREPGGAGLLGQAWATITVIMLAALFYVSIFSVNEIGYFFWYFSGLVAATAARVRVARRRETRAASVPARWAAAAQR
jgi:hypothetical protein